MKSITASPLFYGLLGLITLLRLSMLLTSGLPLFADEAQYWSWSQALDVGYYSKPPMIAWAIAATTFIAGHGEWAIRLGSLVWHAATTIIIYRLALAIEGRPLWAMLSALGYLLLPAVAVSSMLASTDAPLLTFWALSMLCLWQALHRPHWGWWIGLGLGLGLGMLSKYSMLFWEASALLYGCGDARYRGAWRHFLPGVLLSLVLALVIFLPNLWWNLSHQWVSLTHTVEISGLQRHWFHPMHGLEFLAGQIAMLSPLYAILALFLFRYRRQWYGPLHARDASGDGARFLWCFTWPMLASITLLSLLSGAKMNWAAPAYIGAIMLITHGACRKNWIKPLTGVALLHLLLNGLIGWYDGAMAQLHYRPTCHGSFYPGRDPFCRMRGMPALGNTLMQRALPDHAVIIPNRKLFASLLYYTRTQPMPFFKWNPSGGIGDHYDLTRDLATAPTPQGSFMVIADEALATAMRPCFESMSAYDRIRIATHPDRVLEYSLYRATSFKGYASCALPMK